MASRYHRQGLGCPLRLPQPESRRSSFPHRLSVEGTVRVGEQCVDLWPRELRLRADKADGLGAGDNGGLANDRLPAAALLDWQREREPARRLRGEAMSSAAFGGEEEGGRRKGRGRGEEPTPACPSGRPCGRRSRCRTGACARAPPQRARSAGWSRPKRRAAARLASSRFAARGHRSRPAAGRRSVQALCALCACQA